MCQASLVLQPPEESIYVFPCLSSRRELKLCDTVVNYSRPETPTHNVREYVFYVFFRFKNTTSTFF